MASMDSHVKKGGDITKEIESGVKEIQEMGKEFQGVKDSLKGMPDDLDADLKASIQNIEDTGRNAVLKDIASTQKTVIDAAKAKADTLKTDVNTKISDNTKAKTKLEGIKSKYGSDAKSKAVSSIDGNTKKGQGLVADLEATIKQSGDDVQNVKDNI